MYGLVLWEDLSRWSGGKFETFNQFNSGMPNDLVYCVICDGKDVWVATGGGAGHYDTYTQENGKYSLKRMLRCMNHGHMAFQPVMEKFLLLPGEAV